MGRIVIAFKLWAGKAVELNGVFCGSLEDKSVERNADDGGMTCEVSERCKDSTILYL